MSSSTTISQASCFYSINRDWNQHLRKPFMVALPVRSSKFPVVIQLQRNGNASPSLQTNTRLNSSASASNFSAEGVKRSHQSSEEPLNGNLGKEEELHEQVSTQPIKAAKIHDFCFGIPFGGLVLVGGLVGFLFSRNPLTLSTGVLYGGALLALSTFSLKVWRQGKSSKPFILGQTVLSAALLWKHFQTYSLTKKLFPAGFYAVLSAGMLVFYSYVMISGGNPPSKKSKLAATSPPS